jgi:hypothetical protein
MLETISSKIKGREKMTKAAKAEKRLFPRIDYQLPLQVVANGYDFVTYTKNVSCIGAYCHIDKYVPPFTRVNIKMSLPHSSGPERCKPGDIECKGVIVRTEDENNGGYNVAIFFNGITESCREKISHYVTRLLPQYCIAK